MIYYLQNILQLATKEQILSGGFNFSFAIIPMIVYLASTFTSMKLKFFYNSFGRYQVSLLLNNVPLENKHSLLVLLQQSLVSLLECFWDHQQAQLCILLLLLLVLVNQSV